MISIGLLAVSLELELFPFLAGGLLTFFTGGLLAFNIESSLSRRLDLLGISGPSYTSGSFGTAV